ncbi:hypothetical protein AAC387_Pa01g3382 [Persea americana]
MKMKIFGWIHRKLHTNVDYSMYSPEKDLFSGKKSSAVLTYEKDTEALLFDRDHVPLVDVLGNGILAIGTFGIDQLKLFEFQDEYFVQEEEEEYGALEEHQEELNPLAVTAFNHDASNVVESQPLMSARSENPLRQFLELTEFGREDAEEKRKERTTLADLFKADVAFVTAEKPDATEEISAGNGEKTVVHATKHVRSLAKKLLTGKKGEDSRPTTKLHRLIRSMVKRKIHPDLERKINEGIGSNNPSKIGATLGGPRLDHNLTAEPAGNESRSLLDGVVLG